MYKKYLQDHVKKRDRWTLQLCKFSSRFIVVIELTGVQFGLKSKSNERAARVRFEITSMISDQNCTPVSSITTLLNPF